MAETFSSLYTQLYDQIAFKTSKTATVLKQSIVDALDKLSTQKTLFTEDETSFATVASQATYTSAISGFPGDLAEVTRLYYKLSGKPKELDSADMDVLRFRLDEVATTYPQVYAWHDRKLYLGPPPSGILTLYMDYTKDARRDTASGALITTSSTTQTNDWFDRGVQALRHATLEIFYKSPLFQDQGRAGFQEIQKNAALAELAEQRRQLVRSSGQVSAAWSTGEGNETVYPFNSRYQTLIHR